MTDKFTHRLFSAALLLIFISPWSLDIFSANFKALPTSGWFYLLLSSYYMPGILGDFGISSTSYLLFVLCCYLALWGAPILCLLNWLLATRFQKIFVKINKVLLFFFLSITIIAAIYSLIHWIPFVLLGFWVYLLLLLIIAQHETNIFSIKRITMRLK